MVSLPRLFDTFNIERTRSRNHRITQFALSDLEINRHIESIDTVVMNLNSINIFLEYDWLVKSDSEVNWNKVIICFTRCLKEYKIQYQNILFKSKTRKITPIEK